jgi:chromate transporter
MDILPSQLPLPGWGDRRHPEMQRQVVGIQGWLTAGQFVDGYALSQVTPGPAMLVTGFIGYRVSGLLGALVAMAAMFLPTALLTWFAAPPAGPPAPHGPRR